MQAKRKRFKAFQIWFYLCNTVWKNYSMKTILALILWCILFVLCWPLALALVFLLPLLWLILLPFKILGFTLDLVFKIISGILLFPFKLVGAIK
jgi:hypothetical protein